MKLFKIIGISVLSILILLAIIAAFVQNDYQTSRSIVIDKPVSEVFDYLKIQKNQDNFSVFNTADPNKKVATKGIDGTVGFEYSWDGNDDVGAGKQIITNIIPNQQIDTELRFIRPFESIANARFKTGSISENQTKVTWEMYGTSSYPMNLMNLFTDKMIGSAFEESLQTLKMKLEN